MIVKFIIGILCIIMIVCSILGIGFLCVVSLPFFATIGLIITLIVAALMFTIVFADIVTNDF